MAGNAGTLELLARELATALQPLEQRLAAGNRDAFLAELGFRLPGGLGGAGGAIGTAGVQVAGLAPVIARLTAAIDGDVAERIIQEGVALLGRLTEVFDALDGIGPALDAAVVAAAGLTAAQRARLRAEAVQLPGRLLEFSLISYLEGRNRGAFELLTLTGIVDDVPAPVDPADPTTLPGRRRELHFGRLLAALTDPAGWLRDTFDFGAPGFDGMKMWTRIAAFLEGRDLPFTLLRPPGGPPVLEAYILRLSVDQSAVTARLRMPATLDVHQSIPLGELWALTLDVTSRFDSGLEARIQPPLNVELSPPTGSLELTATAGAKAERGGDPIVLLGQAGSSRIEVTRFAVELGLRGSAALGGSVDVEPSARVELAGGHILIDLSSGDGFIATIAGDARIESDFEITGSWSPSTGLRLEGSGGLDLELPLHVELGPIEVTALHLGVGLDADGAIPIEVAGSFTASLGPISAAIERIGLIADLSFPDGGGNLGVADLAFRFKPPTGVGLALDAGIVAGGGFLSFDEARGEYAGALELEFAGFVEVKAIGLITTRMPDGSEGFSLLIVLTAEFGQAGIQLGFGFKLIAVGGILGLNRRMDLDALVEGVVTGGIQSVMFPKDVIANAPRIISDLRKFFPPDEGTFLVGPMAKIGWGTPTLVSVSLGLIVEIPPGNVAILGLLECVLPSEDVALLALRVSFVGAIEVDKSRLWFFAQLFDSRVLTMTIEGGMGLLVAWGDNPDFVLSVGGFHPSFTPPPLPFPVPPRISVDILNSPGQLIRVSGYFAVTSNTVQFGAKAELRLGFGGFGVEGHLAFDALFRFSPFSFIIRISAGVSLKAFGVGVFSIDLDFTLEGPAPWRAHGRGSISLLFFEISADFDITWGEERTTTLPPVAVLALLEAEVRKVEGWQTRLPAGGFNPMVTLRQLPPGDDLVLHPLGSLFIAQRAIPLGVRIDRVGAQRPSDGKRFTVTPAQNSGLVRRSVTGDKFAMAQFQDMDDAAKLSRPAYETQDAGLELVAAGGAIATPRVVRRSARYELHIIDNEAPSEPAMVRAVAVRVAQPKRGRLYTPPPAVFGQLLAGSSTARSPLSRQEAQQRQPFSAEETVQVPGGRYVVAYLRNNQQAFPPATASATTSSFRSAATAEDAMADWIVADPALAGQLHVLRQAEVLGGVVAESGVWSAAGSPPAAVAGADAVLLKSGQVLVAGGADATGEAVATAAVFDPVAGIWAAQTASLATARRLHTTTRLGDGRVVAAGGLGTNDAPLATVEVFDPAVGTWSTPATGLATARSGHSATIAAKRLLVAGGTSARGAALASAELLDAATMTWTPVGLMAEARTGHAAVVLGTGQVLVVGGAVPTGEGERAVASCELYDPETQTWTPTGDLAVARKGHQATLLPDGRVLVTGGDAVPAIPYRVESLATAEVYDPDTGVWTRVADLPGGGRSGHRCVRTPRGAVVIGGVGRPRATAGFRDVVVFDPATGTWAATGALTTGRWDFPAVSLADGRVFVVGGRTLTGPAAPGPDQLATTAETYLP
jgi:N-acetylneuraminic acid mutarotase